jgi:hypothetical protein
LFSNFHISRYFKGQVLRQLKQRFWPVSKYYRGLEVLLPKVNQKFKGSPEEQRNTLVVEVNAPCVDIGYFLY